MLRDVLEEFEIGRIDNSNGQFIMMDCMTCGSISVTAVATQSQTLYVFVISPLVNVPITSKIETKKEIITKIRISCDVSAVAIFYKDNSFEIFPITNVVIRAHPMNIYGICDKLSFSSMQLNISEDQPPPQRQYSNSPPNSTDTITNAFWWDSGIAGVLLVVTDTAAIKVWKLSNMTAPVLVCPYTGIHISSVKIHRNSAIIYAFNQKFDFHQITLFTEDRKLSIKHKKLSLNNISKSSLLIQASGLHESKWEFGVLQKDLIFYDSIGHDILHVPISGGTRAQPNSFAITKHFIFYSNGGRVAANFFKNLENAKTFFLFGQTSIAVLDYNRDMIACLANGSVTVLRPKAEPENIFREMAQANRWNEAFEICGAFELEFPKICANMASECIKEGKNHEALALYKQGNCGFIEMIHRFLPAGQERFALHVALEALVDESPIATVPKQSLRQVIDILWQRLRVKWETFPSFRASCNRLEPSRNCLLSPDKFRASPLFDKIQEGTCDSVPGPLLYRYYTAIFNEKLALKYINSACKIDLVNPPRESSPQFQALIRQLFASKKSTFENISIKDLMKIANHNTYITKNDLYINNNLISLDHKIIDFEIVQNTIYLLTYDHIVLYSDLSNINFIHLKTNAPILVIRSSNTRIGLISMSGDLTIIEQTGESSVFTGDFIDIAMTETFIVGLTNDGTAMIKNYKDKEFRKIYDDHFIKAVAACGDFYYLFFSPKQCIISSFNQNNGQAKQISLDFNVELSITTKDAAYAAGDGFILVLKGEDQQIYKYSQRIGTITNICPNNDGITIIGTASDATKICFEPKNDTIPPNYDDLGIIAEKYEKDFILPMFNGTEAINILRVLYGDWRDFKLPPDPSVLISNLKRMNVDNAASLIHQLLAANVKLSDDIITSRAAKKLFYLYPDDLKFLTSVQVKMLTQRRKVREYKGIDNVTYKMLQNSTDNTVIPSKYLKEGTTISAFSCGHVLDQDEMKDTIKSLIDFCNENKMESVAKLAETKYQLPLIHAQCPKCLQRNIQRNLA